MYNTGEVMQIKALRAHFPNDQFTIASIYTMISKDICRDAGINYVGGSVPPSKINLVIKVLSLLWQAVLVRLGVMRPRGIIKAYADSTLVINLGGDILGDSISPLYTLAHCYSLLLAVILNKEYVMCSQSIGKFNTIFTKWLACFILKRAELIIVREAETLSYLKDELKIAGVHQLFDLAYLTDKTTSPKLSGTIGILTASLSKKRAGVKPSANVAMLRKLAMYYSTLCGHPVILIPYITKLAGDTELARSIKLPGDIKVGIASDTGRVSLLIGSRMHGLINALTNGIPVVALSYGHKFNALNGNAQILDIKDAVKDIGLIINAANRAIENNHPSADYARSSALESIRLIDSVAKEVEKKRVGTALNFYYGHAVDKDTRQNGASGGVVKALLSAGLYSGLFKTIASVNDDGLLQTFDDVNKIRQGSIYHLYKAETTTRGVYPISSKLCVVSLPCQVNKYRALFPDSTIIGLFCSHAIEIAGLKLILDSLKLSGDIKYRYKHGNKTGLLIDNKVFIPSSEYWSKFFNFCFIPVQCLRCNNQTNEGADISVGDAHGHAEFGKGKNVIITRTPKGAMLLQSAVELGLVNVEETALSGVMKAQKGYIEIKKGMSITPKLRLYLMLRSIGCYLSNHKIYRPLLSLWFKYIIKTVRGIKCQSM